MPRRTTNSRQAKLSKYEQHMGQLRRITEAGPLRRDPMLHYREILQLLRQWRAEAIQGTTRSADIVLRECADQLEALILKMADADSKEIADFALECANVKPSQA